MTRIPCTLVGGPIDGIIVFNVPEAFITFRFFDGTKPSETLHYYRIAGVSEDEYGQQARYEYDGTARVPMEVGA